ncbi:hypothetical protein HBI56_218490 [Parastagonospora nodorum]|uniref:Zn(2)-C6 fungal-type domain-containing protein n=1 Tax=Phaeosphaeria nodorum (strain SN15 / ATCC MYA-4574 / FGSC 10173) TaxID=321614 RepID=A0A7U2FAX6_PHANO|nr:hypothetical protein HBH56_225570 [Parastagonospora nodorum]QRD01857.1 hypothetical protein JI435_303420 [Parastagonospora nodorum SN15]KAH3935874.1 hypothetical protein HBH54_033160 [Parastagonospora nodorum]KAH3940086.1 hypothetical protein HBH53_223610 [Parastagonospora nodorum]KAH3957614.1 hypothetical protein HBH51_223100 [Parastagonospora nodorum]
MSAVVHLPLLNTQNPYMLKDKVVDSFTPTFTTVNGRGSPPTPRTSASTLGMSARTSPPQQTELRPSENGYRSGTSSASSSSSSPDSADSPPNKRPRSNSPDHNVSTSGGMEAPQHRQFPSIDRPTEHERRWTAEPQSLNGYRDMREPRPMDQVHGSMPPMATQHLPLSEHGGFEPGNSTDPSRTAAQQQNDAKKRKRQFANRTKTGCGTCRRRKKKCDEAKPECNNCTRGGFICEGYTSKVPWSKNGAAKQPPPLQAKEQIPPHDLTANYPKCPGCNQIHIPHCEPTRSNSQPYSDHRSLNGSEGARVRPIVVEEQERKPPAPSSWNSGWNEPPRVSYPEHAPSVPAQYPQPPAPTNDRTPSHDHHMPQPQGPPPPRQHNPRIYHHTTQSMSHTASHTPAIADAHHQTPQQPRQPPPMAPPTSAPPAPQPAHYTPQSRAHKTEKEKMLNGEPFLPNDEQLMRERSQCTNAVFAYNSTANPSVVISRGERERNFKLIVAAQWIPPRHMDHRPGAPNGAHLGGNVNVGTPFHCDYGYNISIGDNVTIGAHCRLLDSARIAIGRNVKIGVGVTIQTLKTPTDTNSLKGSNGTEVAAEVHIGENVFIGDNVVIEAGVKVGHHAIIRSGSVVTADIAPHIVARGNPAFAL